MAHPPSEHWKEYRNKRGQDQTIDGALNVINFDKLCDFASDLYGCGERCDVDKTKYAFGGVNIVFELVFNPATVWIARIRMPDNCYPEQGVDYVLESEVTTMRYLHQNTTIPLPSIYRHDSTFR